MRTLSAVAQSSRTQLPPGTMLVKAQARHHATRQRCTIRSSQAAATSTNHDHLQRRAVLMLLTSAATVVTSQARSLAQSSGSTSEQSVPAKAAETEPLKFYKTASGVKFQEVSAGRGGPAAQLGDTVLFDYVLRRSNGYFIYSTVEGASFQPRDVPVAPVYIRVGDPALIAGLNEVLIGMEPGCKRRALIPPALGYISQDRQPQPPTFATKRQLVNHAQEPLLFEVQMLKVNP